MKKRILNLAVVVAVAAMSAYATTYLSSGKLSTTQQNNTEISDNPFSENPVTDAQFASKVVRGEYPDLTYAAENAVRAVVNIEATINVGNRAMPRDPFFEFFGYPQGYGEREARAGGSGVIISEDGYIVTNNHVIDNAKSLRVKLYDGRVFDAKVIGSDPATDVALIKIEA
ncbi:MAG: trypsin-like peptidase domain-containing protein, partial [Alistipes sp.]|nr:trypsin-like peptidase domain-containing protein [Alistipes sp.]